MKLLLRSVVVVVVDEVPLYRSIISFLRDQKFLNGSFTLSFTDDDLLADDHDTIFLISSKPVDGVIASPPTEACLREEDEVKDLLLAESGGEIGRVVEEEGVIVCRELVLELPVCVLSTGNGGGGGIEEGDNGGGDPGGGPGDGRLTDDDEVGGISIKYIHI